MRTATLFLSCTTAFAPLVRIDRIAVVGQYVNNDFEDRLGRARQRTHIEYRQGAFQ